MSSAQRESTVKTITSQITEKGYASPIRVLSAQECQRFLRAASNTRNGPPLDWDKGHAASSRVFYEISTHPAIIEVVATLLGGDVMLWGASIQSRAPCVIHPWHSDIESLAPSGKTVSVWMGIEHTNPDSSMSIISYSHRFRVSVQELRYQFGRGRDETTDEDILRWARERDKRSDLVRLEMTDGQALFLDGQLWHSSNNLSSKTRRALLLQYATPDTMIRIPDYNYLDWPFHKFNLPKPACLMVRGSAKTGVNRIVSAPVAGSWGSSPQLTNRVYPLHTPLPPDKDKGWKPYPIFSGCTGDMRSLSCHTSVLTHGHCPHPPHTHKEEELLLLLAGEVDLILPDVQTPKGDHRKRLRVGQFVYYPAHFLHTLKTVSVNPANYLMFKWYTDETESDSPLAFGHFNVFDHLENSEVQDGFRPRLVFEGPTAYLRKLHCHASTLAPGAGYEPHFDAYDVAIIVLEGEIETLGERLGPYSVIFYPAGEPHGMRNPGEAMAKYVVFEFHGSQKALADALPNLPSPPSLLTKLTDPQGWKRKLKYLFKRFIG
ncbi:MAG TPA: cupin domain-containing protein [Candidatus Dormibacteraeota bacterium]|nr:cupin domain-containing protein [Candidatus Dormibacteraeota bacterium]